MKSTASILALAVWAAGLGACVTATAPPQPLPEPAPGAVTSSEAQPPTADLPPPGRPGDAPPDGAHRACHLAAPKKSDDACKLDVDCAPSDPCHARACVAKAKSKPRTPDTMCTMMMACESADANRCGCLEGRCSLIPPDDAAKE